MAAVDLVFEGAPLHTGHLVFGDDGDSDVSDAVISGSIDVGMPELSGAVALGIVATGAIDIGMPVLSGAVTYVTDTARPLVALARARWQDTDPQHERTAQRWQDAGARAAETHCRYQQAAVLHQATRSAWDDADRSKREARAVRFQDAVRVHVGAKVPFADAVRGFRPAIHSRYQVGDGIHVGSVGRHQDALRGIAGQHRTHYQDATPSPAGVQSFVGSGRAIHRGWGTRYQDAWSPRPGRYGGPVIPPFESCYIPSGHLVFDAPWSADAHLVFICERHPGPDPEPGATVVVPVRRIYTVINTAQLRRVDGDVLIPNLSMALTIDADSWTWGFTASVPGSALPDLEPTGGQPVEVEAWINGVAYRAIVEGISRERTFGSSMLAVSGRGRAAVLDAPYSPIMTFDNAGADRTVQQLANDVLTINGVPLGWDIDAGWKPDDWLVPAGAWSHQGTYISALNAIAGAAGAYLQPHATAQALSVLRRYPVLPWEWNDVTPDFELPAAVVQKEGIVWTDKPLYNRVVVRGMKHGRQVIATRLGTAGDLEAPMVTDQLITNATGGRQRAVPVLADVGRQAAVSLRLPVLPETGIIQPGKFVRFVDGGTTRIGLVRSTGAISVRAEGRLTNWQTIGVETHVSV